MTQTAFDPVPDTLVDTPASRSDSRWQVLGALRFLLAMVVVAGHLTWFVPMNAPPMFLGLLGGTSAVIGFLFVSGYSIGHSLSRRPVGFYRRRLLRIYPLYVVAVLFALVPFLSGADAFQLTGNTIQRPHGWVVIGNLLMLQNLVCRPIDSNMLVWTLGVEVICYLLAPVFRKTKTVFLVVLVIISAAAFSIYPRMGMDHYSTLLFGLPLLMFAWAWLAGFLLHRSGNSMPVGIAVAVLGTIVMILNTTYHTTYSVHTVAAAALVVTFAPWIRLHRSIGTVFNYLGDLSYPIYLFHLPSFLQGYCIMAITNRYGLLAMALAISATFLFTESFFKTILGNKSGRVRVPSV